MATLSLSESAEMYLKAMAELGGAEGVPLTRLAERLNVTPVSASEMIRRLNEQGLVSHKPYKGASLTRRGREAASSVLRRQRLWEVFLYQHLKIEWSRIYELACSLEHATAPEVTEALAGYLGHPRVCPRGNPIPGADGTFTPLEGMPLSEAAVGEAVRILAVNATATEVLTYLQERGILPGREVTLVEAAPLQGPLTLRVGEKEVALGLQMADFVIVESLP